MNRLFKAILPLVALAAVSCGGKGYVTGRVECEGRGLGGVVVSDGHATCRTGAGGRYRLRSTMPEGYVFISLPSGYEAPAEGLIPRFFTRQAAGARFSLKKVCQDEFRLMVFTDLHLTGDKVDDDLRQFHGSFYPDFRESAVRMLEKGPAYTLCLGDMTTDGKWYRNSFALPEYLAELKDYPMPIFHIMGNHDNDQKGKGSFEEWATIAERRYKEEIGPDYYSMNIGGVHFLMLDDIVTFGPRKDGCPALDPIGKFGFSYMFDDEQLEWIRKDLRYVPEDVPLVVCFHVPLFKDGRKVVHNAEDLLGLLEPYRKVDLLCGHFHTTRIDSLAPNILQHTIASASTVSWKLNDVAWAPLICDDGTPAGYQMFTFRNGQADWVYKSVYAPVERSQFKVYDLGNGQALINVFNWDPSWKVKASCDGKPVTLERVWADDPDYVRLRSETKMLLKRPKAFLPVKAPHFFKCRPDGDIEDLEVEITDRFGNHYSSF